MSLRIMIHYYIETRAPSGQGRSPENDCFLWIIANHSSSQILAIMFYRSAVSLYSFHGKVFINYVDNINRMGILRAVPFLGPWSYCEQT